MSTTLAPPMQRVAAHAANAAFLRDGLPAPYDPCEFDENGHFNRKLYLSDQVIPFEDTYVPLWSVEDCKLVHTINFDVDLFPEEEKLVQTSPDWKVRWELRGKLWLCEHHGFSLSNNPLASFEIPDTLVIDDLDFRTDTVGEYWNAAIARFPLIPSKQLLPVVSTRMLLHIRCPFPHCKHLIVQTEDVEDHLATAHFFDDPARNWLREGLLSTSPRDIDCSCIYDSKTGAALDNTPEKMNRKEFLDHIVQEHFYAEAVHCRFCGVSIIGSDMYPRHMVDDCPVLRPWMDVYDASIIPQQDDEAIDIGTSEKIPSRKSERIASRLKKACYAEPDSDVEMDDDSMDVDDASLVSSKGRANSGYASPNVGTEFSEAVSHEENSDALSDLTELSDEEDVASQIVIKMPPLRRSLRFMSKPRKVWQRRDV
ncbi:hypothetical protein VNI00_006429 [Paramarasmius palmivorus]|uniref:C2H2-type domain-containing protein n=1 Tax=Paramarasmius palmivorus TaxID=297713 RepID=A0AAW0D7Z2_9AGAR